VTALALLGLTLEQLLAERPGLTVHDDEAEIQEANTRAYARDPAGEFEAVFGDKAVVDTVFVCRESPLLDGLVPFASTRGDVLRRFGEPSVSGGEMISPFLGPQGAWDRFDYPRFSLHFQYAAGTDRVKLVTVMTADVARRVSS
jgi:hypothetical protein